jgi:hypothetical protein
MLALLKKTNAYFSKSTFSSTLLRDARETAEIAGGGLIKIGKTRFGTHWTSAVGLRRCLPFIKDLMNSGTAKPKVFGSELYMECIIIKNLILLGQECTRALFESCRASNF